MSQAPERTIYVGNVGKEVDDATLHALFGHCGMVTQIRIAGDPSYDTRYAFIEFGTEEEAQTAILLDGMAVFDRSIRVSMARGGGGPGRVASNDPDRVQRTVHVGGIPMDEVSEEMLAEYFSHIGEVTAVRKSGRFAWVEFSTLSAAQQSLALDGESLASGTLKISASKTPIHTAGWRAAPKTAKPPPMVSSGVRPPISPPQPPPPQQRFMPPAGPPPPYGPPPPGPPPPYGPPPPNPPGPMGGHGSFGGYPQPPPGPPGGAYQGGPPPSGPHFSQNYGPVPPPVPPQGPPPIGPPPMGPTPPSYGPPHGHQYGGPPHGPPPPRGGPPHHQGPARGAYY